MARVGFLVNPVAGLGGRVGLKGTDNVVEEAVARGASPVAPTKAREMLRTLASMPQARSISWLTCSGPMGGDLLEEVGWAHDVVDVASSPTSAEDTRRACRRFLEREAELIVFVGGDGTARDIVSVVDGRVPIVGVPSGVKMHSAVFGLHSASVAAILADFAEGDVAVVEAEVLDLDEDRYREGEWVVRLYASAKTLHEPTRIQTGKMMFEELPEQDAREAITEHLIEEMDEHPNTLYLLGPGGTLRHLKDKVGPRGTLLGVDAARGRRLIATDLDERGVLQLLEVHPAAKLVLSPIGAQGFILGRGNLEISPAVVRKVGLPNLILVATPDKLRHTPVLRVDTGDPDLDREFLQKGYLFVVQGYRESRVQTIGA